MARSAFLIPYPGAPPIPVNISEVNKATVGIFRCDGSNRKGEKCNARMGTYISSRDPSLSRFQLYSRHHRHIPGCSCDESRHAVVLSRLILTGRGTTTDSLLDLFSKNPSSKPPTPKPPTTPFPFDEDEAPPGNTADRPQETHVRHPRNLSEYAALLIHLDKDAYYAGRKVSDQIIDEENIQQILNFGLSSPRISVTLCRFVGTNWINREIPDRPKDLIVLQDAYAFMHKRRGLLVLFSATPEARKKILSASRDKIIAIMARWEPYPIKRGKAIICHTPVTPGQILVRDAKFFENI